jgi:hypothetical protein
LVGNPFLTGLLPSSIYLLSSQLTSINVGGNVALSAGVSQLSALRSLTIESNTVVPMEIYSLSRLFYLVLGGSRRLCLIPTDIGKLTNLNYLHLNQSDCRGGSTLPKEIGQLTFLQSLRLLGLSINGTVPETLWNVANLNELLIDNTNLTGTLSTGLGQLTNLNHLRVANNRGLNSTLPSQIGTLTRLGQLELVNCPFIGPLPTTVGRLGSLHDLRISNTSIGPALPSELGGLKRLLSLTLNNNQFVSTIPTELANLPSVNTLDISFNHFHGEFPSQLALLVRDGFGLSQFSCAGNNLTGRIPPEFVSLRNCTVQDSFAQRNCFVSAPANCLNNSAILCAFTTATEATTRTPESTVEIATVPITTTTMTTTQITTTMTTTIPLTADSAIGSNSSMSLTMAVNETSVLVVDDDWQQIAIIVGSAAGGAFLSCVVIATVIVCRRRRQRDGGVSSPATPSGSAVYGRVTPIQDDYVYVVGAMQHQDHRASDYAPAPATVDMARIS